MRRLEEGLIMLTCALGQKVQPLTTSEFLHMERFILSLQKPDPDQVLTDSYFCSIGYNPTQAARFAGLLNRDKVLHNYLNVPELKVVTRLSDDYPKRLHLLRSTMPTVLFCKGDTSLLSTRCVALVGSRTIAPRNWAFAERIGTLAAREGFTLVSGGAPGADTAAQNACLAAGGNVICIIPNELSRYRATPHVLYCSDAGWDLGFTATRALRRNHYIHALGEKTFVAACPYPKGGTWSGTSYNLNHRLSEVYILDDDTEGCRILSSMGAVAVRDDIPSIGDLFPKELSIFD